MAGCGNPSPLRDCGPHIACVAVGTLWRGQADPQGRHPALGPSRQWQEAGQVRPPRVLPGGTEEQPGRAHGHHSLGLKPGLRGPREETGGAGQAQPMPSGGCQRALVPGTQAWALTPVSSDAYSTGQGPNVQREGRAPLSPEHFPGAECPPVEWGRTGAPLWTGSFSHPFWRKGGHPARSPAAFAPPGPRSWADARGPAPPPDGALLGIAAPRNQKSW